MHQSTIGDSTSSEMMGMSMGTSSSSETVLNDDCGHRDRVERRRVRFLVVRVRIIRIAMCRFFLCVFSSRSRRTKWLGIFFAVLAFFSLAALILLEQESFKVECLGDGNAWGMMQPMIAGEMLSDMPAEGCMWGMGNYVYQFTDPGRISVLRKSPARIRLAHELAAATGRRSPDDVDRVA